MKQISEVSSPELQKVIEVTGGSVESFSTSLSKTTETMSTIITDNLGDMSTGIADIVKDLESYSNAIKALVDKINDVDKNSNKKDKGSSDQTSVSDTIAKMQANSIKWHTASEAEKEALHKENLQLGASIGATYDEASGKWTYPATSSSSSSSSGSSSSGGTSSSSKGSSSSSSSSSSSGGSSSKNVNTSDQYVDCGGGFIQSNPNWDGKTQGGVGSFYKYADGTRYTAGGLSLMGEDGEEFYIPSSGRLIPISQPTIGNIGAGGVVFNREQMANLRSLWDLSNLGKISPFVSSSNVSKQNTTIDNSIHINGLTVGEQGNEDWINGLRRYVATHK